jgi:hypothetical protein
MGENPHYHQQPPDYDPHNLGSVAEINKTVKMALDSSPEIHCQNCSFKN